MKYASQWALLGATVVVGIAYSCATPQEIDGCQRGVTSSDCDVILVPASEFEADASVSPLGGAGSGSNPPGGNAGTGNATPPPPAGNAGSGSNNPPLGGSAGTGSAGSGANAGAGGAGGAAGSGAAGTGGAAGSAAGAPGSAGAGGTSAQSNFDPGSCDFNNRTGCEAQACATACPANMGPYCTTNCPNIITCVAADPSCITAQDPMCALRTNGQPNDCTTQVESSGGANTTNANDPAFVARALVQCLCDSTRL